VLTSETDFNFSYEVPVNTIYCEGIEFFKATYMFFFFNNKNSLKCKKKRT